MPWIQCNLQVPKREKLHTEQGEESTQGVGELPTEQGEVHTEERAESLVENLLHTLPLPVSCVQDLLLRLERWLHC